MKSAARLVPSFRQALRAPVAGPSRPALVRAASTAAPVEAEAEVEAQLPANISFQDVSGSRKAISTSLLERGQRLHAHPESPFAPIEHPLSSFASVTPTAAASEAGSVILSANVFRKPLRKDILHRNVVWYLSTLRAGNQSTKTRSTVAYSGRKLRPQKGSGKARVGDASSGIRRGGAPIHALKPRNWAQGLPRKVRKLGLQTALSSKLSSGLLRVVPNFNEAGWAGTRDVVHALGDGIVEGEAADGADNKVFMERFGPKTNMSILFLYSPLRTNEDELFNFSRIIRNIPNVELLSTDEVVAYDILKYRWVVLETSAVDALSMDDMVFDFDAADAAFTEQLDAQINAAEAEHPLEPAQPQVKSVNLDASA